MTTTKRRQIRRILVALDASPGSLVAARAAVALAALLDAELAGLFVEDPVLLRLSRSPVARQVDLLTAAVDRLESHQVETQLRAQANRAKRILMRLAEEAGLEWSFRVARGAVAQEIQNATSEDDLVSLGRVGWSLRQHRLLGTTARQLLAQPRRRTLLSKTKGEIRPPVVVLFDDSPAAHEALDLAVDLFAAVRDGLTVMLIGGDPIELRRQVVGHLGAEVAAIVGIEPGTTVDRRLCHRLRRMGTRMVIAPIGSHSLAERDIQALLDGLDCPILAVS